MNEHYREPAVTEETYHGKIQLPLSTCLLTDRTVFIEGEIDDALAMDFLKEMMYFSKTDDEVNIYINSPGGKVDSGLIIYDVIQRATFPINFYCVGMAGSMAAVILAGGQQGRRYIFPHSKVMIHEPLISGGFGGSATSIKNTADSIIEVKNTVNGILAKHIGRDIEEINKATNYDNFMNAKEAVEFGICDEIRINL